LLLAQAKDEAARSNQLRNSDIASLVEQQPRITELSDKLRVASATLDMERQLTAEGKDIRELLTARQLHGKLNNLDLLAGGKSFELSIAQRCY
jgi:hypothetical protein